VAGIEQLAKSRYEFGLADAPASAFQAHRRSPTCGEEFTVRVLVADGRIESLHWEGHGCVVSAAACRTTPGATPRSSRRSGGIRCERAARR
jgi:NifU-like protein involved in Fe-S cluster formation